MARKPIGTEAYGMHIWSWKRPEKDSNHVGDVGAECEAFLHGRYVEYLDTTGSAVPSWAWLNMLVHGTEYEIASLANHTASQEDTPGRAEWKSVLSLLAVETLGLARTTGRPVAEIQRCVLVDVELALAREVDNRRLRPREVAGRTMAALHGHPSDRR